MGVIRRPLCHPVNAPIPYLPRPLRPFERDAHHLGRDDGVLGAVAPDQDGVSRLRDRDLVLDLLSGAAIDGVRGRHGVGLFALGDG